MKKGLKQVSQKVILDEDKKEENEAHDGTKSMYLGKKVQPNSVPQEYQLNDTIHAEMVFYGDVHSKVLSNERGMFIDIRKYAYGKPTRRGVRMPIEEFKKMGEWTLKSIKDYQECDK